MNLYAAHSTNYAKRGWTLVATKGKAPVFPGVTGKNGKVTEASRNQMRDAHDHNNIAIRHGHDTIAIDIDQGDGKRGADTLQQLQAALGELPPTYTSTARGPQDPRRQAFYRKPEGVKLVSNLRTGQVIGGVTLDTGDIELPQHDHRYSVVWPSVHPDTGATYTWYDREGQPMTEPPHVDDLPELPPAWVTALTESNVRPSAGAAPGGRQTLKELLATPGSGEGRNTWLTRVAGHYARNHRADEVAYRAAVVEANLLLPVPLADTEVNTVADSIWKTEQAKPGAPDGQDKKQSAYKHVVTFLHETYEFYRTSAGDPYAVPVAGVRRPIALTERGEGGLKGKARYDYGRVHGQVVNDGTLTQALQSIYWETHFGDETQTQDLSLRVVRTDPGTVVLDLGQPGNTRCVVITADGWTVQDHPPKGVTFRTTGGTQALPDPVRGDSEALRHLLGWDATDSRWLLVRGWLAVSLLPDIARPILFFHGRSGSAKTSRAVAVVSVTDPRDELGGSFGKNEKDEVAMASNRYLVGWDNVSSASAETSDRLCRLVTGTSDERRVLYSDNDQLVISYRRTGVITGLSVPTFKPDALDRLIQIECDPIERGDRLAEGAIRRQFAESHPAALAAVLDDLVVVLRNLPVAEARVAERPRMADFGNALWALDPQIAEVYESAQADALVEAAESDPFASTVVGWLRIEHQRGSLPLSLTPSEAHAEAASHQMHRVQTGQWWPHDARSFSGALVRAAGPIEALGFRATRRKSNGKRLWVFEALSDEVPPGPLWRDEPPF